MTDTTDAVRTARDYYDSTDADTFYATIWGGEDIHVGMYESDDEPIAAASRRTVVHLADRLDPAPGTTSSVIDLGAGYGGAARYLAERFGCRVVALNLSVKENERNRALTAERGLDDLVTVVDGSFHDVPADDASFDVVWCQDAILHIGDRRQVLAEAYRVLRPGGQFVFTDPMQADDCPEGVLQPILDRIHLPSMGSPGYYLRTAAEVGFGGGLFDDQTPQLVRHYSRVLEETERRAPELAGAVDPDYVTRMKAGLTHWIEGGRRGHLAWGVFHLRRPA